MKKFICTLAVAVAANVPHMVYAVDQDNEVLREGKPGAPAELSLDDLRTFTDVFSQIRQNYVESVDDKSLLNAAINGMLSELDPHSAYLLNDQLQDLDETSRGQFNGIGVNVEVVDFRIVVQAVISPSPADSAGINPGDVIISIDGRPVKGRDVREAIDELRGEPGTKVILEVLTPGDEARELTLVRKVVDIPSLTAQVLEGRYGYFRVSHFNRETATHFEQSLESMAGDGIRLQGLIIDLRDNPGGVLQPAVSLADGFLDDGLIVSTRGRNAAMQLEFSAHPGQWLQDVPVVVLIDRGSASASEVLAGALQDHGRALIVGEKSFGKGSVQSVLPLRNGSGIKLTTARYYTPSGRSIQAEGIVPDVALRPVEFVDRRDLRIRESDLDRHLERESEDAAPEVRGAPDDGNTALKDDQYVQEALSLLKGAIRAITGSIGRVNKVDQGTVRVEGAGPLPRHQ